MDDPLTVVRAQLLGMVDRLEAFYQRLQDVEAGVPDDWLVELEGLRDQINSAQSRATLLLIWGVLKELLKVASTELIKRLFDTLSCLLTAAKLRSGINDSWRSNKIVTYGCWRSAA